MSGDDGEILGIARDAVWEQNSSDSSILPETQRHQFRASAAPPEIFHSSVAAGISVDGGGRLQFHYSDGRRAVSMSDMAASGCRKTHTLEVRKNFIALGCPINDVLDFGGHFLSFRRDSFFKRGGFSTASYPSSVQIGEEQPPA